MQTVSFTAMKKGTQADYRLQDRYEQQHVTTLPDRILDTLARLGEGRGGAEGARLPHHCRHSQTTAEPSPGNGGQRTAPEPRARPPARWRAHPQ